MKSWIKQQTLVICRSMSKLISCLKIQEVANKKNLFPTCKTQFNQNLKPCKKYCRYVKSFTLGWNSNTETATKYSASPLQSHSSFHHLLVLFMQTAITSSPFKVEGPTTIYQYTAQLGTLQTQSFLNNNNVKENLAALRSEQCCLCQISKFHWNF